MQDNIYAASVRNNVCMGDEVNEDRLIYVLDKAGEGTHEYLINLLGGYYKLFQAQFE